MEEEGRKGGRREEEKKVFSKVECLAHRMH
jgi:hypothetical protein